MLRVWLITTVGSPSWVSKWLSAQWKLALREWYINTFQRITSVLIFRVHQLFQSKEYKCGEEILTIAAMTTVQVSTLTLNFLFMKLS